MCTSNECYHFPDAESDSSSYSSTTTVSSSEEEEERYAAATKRKLPVYMRLGTAQQLQRSSGHKIKLRNQRSQVGLRLHASYSHSHSLCVHIALAYRLARVYIRLKFNQ